MSRKRIPGPVKSGMARIYVSSSTMRPRLRAPTEPPLRPKDPIVRLFKRLWTLRSHKEAATHMDGKWPAKAAAITLALSLAVLAAGRIAPVSAQTSSSDTAVVAMYEEPSSLNPILGPQMDFATMVELTMFPNLFGVQPDGKLTPDLAAVVPTVQNGGISKDGLTYTFHLRPHVEWSDGQPFTAQDVLKTYQLLVDPQVNALTTAGFNQVTKAEVIDPLTIRFTLKRPYAPFLTTCCRQFRSASSRRTSSIKSPPRKSTKLRSTTR